MKEQPRGDMFGFDVRTGKKLWTFHSVPQAGEFGHDTWENDSADYTGNTNVWSMMTVDEELGYVYLPFGTPTNDYYGGHRPGDNLFAESLVCLDAKTGKRVWHFQAVHHGLWDYDFPAAPILVDITVDGTPHQGRRAGQQAGVRVRLRSRDRRARLADRGAARAAVDRAWRDARRRRSRSRPSRRRSIVRACTTTTSIDFTPELHAQALEVLKQCDRGPLFTPPSERGTRADARQRRRGRLGRRGGRSRDRHALRAVDHEPDHRAAREGRPGDAGNMAYRRGGTQTNLPTLDGIPLYKPPYSRRHGVST